MGESEASEGENLAGQLFATEAASLTCSRARNTPCTRFSFQDTTPKMQGSAYNLKFAGLDTNAYEYLTFPSVATNMVCFFW